MLRQLPRRRTVGKKREPQDLAILEKNRVLWVPWCGAVGLQSGRWLPSGFFFFFFPYNMETICWSNHLVKLNLCHPGAWRVPAYVSRSCGGPEWSELQATALEDSDIEPSASSWHLYSLGQKVRDLDEDGDKGCKLAYCTEFQAPAVASWILLGLFL